MTGVFGDYIVLSNGEDLNLYTCVRGLIVDFTLPGTMLMVFLAGFLLQRRFLHLAEGNPLNLASIAAGYLFIVTSPIVSMFSYNGVVLAFAGTLLVLHFGMPKMEKA